jgi:Tol biopolymer transport system component
LATDAFPQFSPDGGRIVFVRELPAATSSDPLASTELWVMNADGSGQRRLTHCTQDLEPSWSPDGP